MFHSKSTEQSKQAQSEVRLGIAEGVVTGLDCDTSGKGAPPPIVTVVAGRVETFISTGGRAPSEDEGRQS